MKNTITMTTTYPTAKTTYSITQKDKSVILYVYEEKELVGIVSFSEIAELAKQQQEEGKQKQ